VSSACQGSGTVKLDTAAYSPGVPALAAVEFVSPAQGWVAGAAGILATSDGGASWAADYRGADKLYQVDFTDAGHGWAVGTTGLLATGDGGRTWTALPEPCGLVDSVHFVSAVRGYAVVGAAGVTLDAGTPTASNGGRLEETSDGGRSWSAVPGAPDQVTSACFGNAEDGYLGTPGRVWRSTDGGADWSVSLSEPPAANGQAEPPGDPAVECADSGAWTLFLDGGAAMNHSPYLAYASPDGGQWHAVLEETYTESALHPRVHAPDGPGTYPGPFSVLSPSSAAYVGWTPPDGLGAAPLDTVSGGTAIARDGNVGGMTQPFAVAFLSASEGWVVGADQTSAGRAGPAVVEHTSDGGRAWTRQYTSS
jgi:photosystem II stability/assembly factor-like uncharacterized protein